MLQEFGKVVDMQIQKQPEADVEEMAVDKFDTKLLSRK